MSNHEVKVKIQVPARAIGVKVNGSSKNMTTDIQMGKLPFPRYDGEVEFTPSDTVQVIPTLNRVVLSDIRINPIPSNYGLITYNGSSITVS